MNVRSSMVCLCVCVCCSRRCSLQKRLNQSRCTMGVDTMDPRNHVLYGLRDLYVGRGYFWVLSNSLKSIGSLCCGVCSRRDRAIVNNGTTVWLLQLMSHFIVAREQSAPIRCGLSFHQIKFFDHLFQSTACFGLHCADKYQQFVDLSSTSLMLEVGVNELTGQHPTAFKRSYSVGWASCRKIEWWDDGMVICLEWSANDLYIVQLVPLSRYIKIQNGLPFWYQLTITMSKTCWRSRVFV